MGLLALLCGLAVQAQMVEPVHFSSQLKMLGGNEAEIIFSGNIDAGWHVYSTELGSDGPIAATFNVVKMDGAEPVGKLKVRGREIKQYDKMFGMELRYLRAAHPLHQGAVQHRLLSGVWSLQRRDVSASFRGGIQEERALPFGT